MCLLRHPTINPERKTERIAEMKSIVEIKRFKAGNRVEMLDGTLGTVIYSDSYLAQVNPDIPGIFRYLSIQHELLKTAK